MKRTSSSPRFLVLGVIALILLTLALLPLWPCPQPCCDLPGKLARLQELPGVTLRDAERMVEWAEAYPCATSGMRKRVTWLGSMQAPAH